MHKDSKFQTSRAIIDISEEHPDDKRRDGLPHIPVNDGEKRRRHHDGQKRALAVPHQSAKHQPTTQPLFEYRGQYRHRQQVKPEITAYRRLHGSLQLFRHLGQCAVYHLDDERSREDQQHHQRVEPPRNIARIHIDAAFHHARTTAFEQHQNRSD